LTHPPSIYRLAFVMDCAYLLCARNPIFILLFICNSCFSRWKLPIMS